MPKNRWVVGAVTALLLVIVATACSKAAPTTDESAAPVTSVAPHDEEVTFGEPGESGTEDRVIEVTQLDEMRFDPASVQVKAGETIRFEVSNAGQTTHEFVLGDAAFQADHEEEMAAMGGTPMVNEPNAIAVEPGQTGTVVWTFTESGTLEYGCHVPGHYPAGMTGQLTVS